MKRVILIILSVILTTVLGCGDEEQGFPNPLQIEFLSDESDVSDEEEPSFQGNITGQILFTDSDDQIQARALSSNEYLILQGSSAKLPGKNLVVFIDFPSNNVAYLMKDGYFQITGVQPGTHELILTATDDVIIEGDPDILPDGNFAVIDVPTHRWTVAVEPDRNTTMGLLTVAILDLENLEWKSGTTGQEVIVPPEPDPPIEPPVVPPVTRPPSQPIDEEGLWFAFDFETLDVTLDVLTAVSGYEDPGFQDTVAEPIVAGAPELVRGVSGNAWRFDGVNTKINLNDFESMERVFDKETVSVWFNVDGTNVGDGRVSMIYEEGGGTNGMALLVADDLLIAVTRDAGEAFQKELATPFTDAGNWHHAAIVYDEGQLTLYLDGVRANSLFCPGAGDGYADQTVDNVPYIHPISQHTSNAAIGGAQGSSYSGLADDASFFAGMIDDFRVYNYAFSPGEVVSLARGLAVEPAGKLTSTWGVLKKNVR